MRKFFLVGALAVAASSLCTRSASAFFPFQSLNPYACINCAGFGPGQHCYCLSHFQGLNQHGPLYNYTPGPGPIAVPGYKSKVGCNCPSSVGMLGHLGEPTQSSLGLHGGSLFGFVHGQSACGGSGTGCATGCGGCGSAPAGAPAPATSAPASLPAVTQAVYPVSYSGYAPASYPLPGYYNPSTPPVMTGSGFSFGR